MAKQKQTLSLLDLKGKISFADGYDYKSLRTRMMYESSWRTKWFLDLPTYKLLPKIC